MSYLPILFSSPMIRALLDGRKTMTRFVLKPQPPSFTPNVIDIGIPHQDDSGEWGQIETIWSPPSFDSPRGEPLREEWRPLRLPAKAGDRLWVREAWAHDEGPAPYRGAQIYYRADVDLSDNKTVRQRPSIHMPLWASRLTLIVESVKVERLQDISEEDALAQGIYKIGSYVDCDGDPRLDGLCYEQDAYHWDKSSIKTDDDLRCAPSSARNAFRKLWAQINGPDSWTANPWVAAIRFRVIKANIDTLDANSPVRAKCEGVAG